MLGVLRQQDVTPGPAKADPDPGQAPAGDGAPARQAPLSPAPGLAGLDRLIERTRGAGVRVTLEVSGQRRPAPAGVDLSAYRIVQEALTNVVRHAGTGARCVVSLGYTDSDLVIRVTDDGGLPAALPAASAAAPGTGHGIIGMRERVHLCGGTFERRAAPGGGFQVTAALPLPAADPRTTGPRAADPPQGPAHDGRSPQRQHGGAAPRRRPAGHRPPGGRPARRRLAAAPARPPPARSPRTAAPRTAPATSRRAPATAFPPRWAPSRGTAAAGDDHLRRGGRRSGPRPGRILRHSRRHPRPRRGRRGRQRRRGRRRRPVRPARRAADGRADARTQRHRGDQADHLLGRVRRGPRHHPHHLRPRRLRVRRAARGCQRLPAQGHAPGRPDHRHQGCRGRRGTARAERHPPPDQRVRQDARAWRPGAGGTGAARRAAGCQRRGSALRGMPWPGRGELRRRRARTR